MTQVWDAFSKRALQSSPEDNQEQYIYCNFFWWEGSMRHTDQQ